MDAKNIMRVVPGLQATALAVRATDMIPKAPTKMKPGKFTKKFIRGTTDIIVGTGLIKPTSSMINKL